MSNLEPVLEAYGNQLIGGGLSKVQSDWNQSDSTKPDYIKNKPTITSTVASESTDLITSGGVYTYVDTMITQALSGSY